MSVRGTMSSLITRTRLMIADTSGSPLFLDQDVQDKLDENRTDLWQAMLTPKITYLNPGGFLYGDYYYIPTGNPRDKALGFFEANEVLVWGDWTILTPDTSDELVGHWTFTAGQLPPVLIRGRHFDIYRTAADLLDLKIANLAATSLDVTSDGQSFHLSQQLVALEKMRDSYRRKQRAVTHQTHRLDGEGIGDEGSGIQPRQASLVGSVSAGVPFLTGP